MKEIVKKCAVEIVRVILTALLAFVGLETSGCVANGDNSTAAIIAAER